MPPTHPTPRRPARRALGVAGAAAVATALLAGFGASGAAAADPSTVSWEEGTSSGELTLVLDGDTLEAGDEVGIHVTWTYLGPTEMADDGEDPVAACESALGATYERSVSASVPAVLLGTSADLGDYRLDGEEVVGPVAAVLRPEGGTGTERIRPERCLDDGTPVARTVREFDATYTVPADLLDGTYAALVPDPGYDRWWTDGTPAVVAVGVGALPPGSTPSTAAGATDAATATTVAGGATDATAADPTTATTAAEGTATTAPGDAASSTTAADGGTDTTAVAGTDAPVTPASGSDDATSSGRLAIDAARTGLAVLGALGAAAVTWKSRQQPAPDVAEKLRMLTSLAALMALAGVGLSLLVASFDSPFIIGLLGLALAVLPQPAVRRVAGPGAGAKSAPAGRAGGRPSRSTAARPHGRAPARPARRPAAPGEQVLQQELAPGTSVDDVRRMLERSGRDDR